MNVETRCGGGAIDITHLMAFQDVSDKTSVVKENISVPKSKKRRLDVNRIDDSIAVNHKKEPDITIENEVATDVTVNVHFSSKYFLWLYMRKMNSFDQIIATFPGWLLKLREQANGTTQ